VLENIGYVDMRVHVGCRDRYRAVMGCMDAEVDIEYVAMSLLIQDMWMCGYACR